MKNTCSANKELFYIENFVKTSPSWLQLVFHFGTENRADQLKKPPCTYIGRDDEKFKNIYLPQNHDQILNK